jgi:antitoxin (DNA-binding transcriptional repressor) of toxin-antitoxin stability system
MTTITLAQAKTQLDELLAKAARGEDVAITSDDGKVFRLILSPATPKGKRGLVGSHRGGIWMADDFDETPEDFKDYLGED